ncbi:hypothetical protein DPMN_177824 [Dreissena polymorpha]|uniref:Uncharacterized protein n=1 Tax=Dreissena polymorpha TaxID=45954 RepID=A0A9D4EAX4_DREPO|nr:hypothetical protein DPMN_177824 [Dreissena polymorpha]
MRPPPPGSHKTNVLTKFHENWAKNVTSRRKLPRSLDTMFFSPIWTIFELVQDINKTNVLTTFHDDWANIVTSRVFTRKTAPPTVGNDCQQTGTTFELHQHIIKTKIIASFDKTSTLFTSFKLDRGIIGTILTKFHEDQTRNVASRADGRTTDKDRSQKLT